MNLFEFENQQFGDDLWTEENIEKVKSAEPPKRKNIDILESDEISDEKYREYQEQNFNEYFTGSYKYCLWK